ncbi:hypothetical protein AVEN_130339-1 [Araneus ventricosus]|uniref:Uncharacterized protein n=1 Tax=Araneus ventricosus TaxID=182803 RepID=A0A4Y2BGF6_ARAVE|nr:hypothetical protein AVEN_130339-1 [Araneus ventricosus]
MSVLRRPLLEIRLFSRRGTSKNHFCSRVCGMARTFRRNVNKSSDIKGSKSTDRDLSTVPTGCCRLGLWKCTARRIPTGNKPLKTKVKNRTIEHGDSD